MKSLFLLLFSLSAFKVFAQVETMLPKTPFNEAQAKAQMSRGKSMIKGRAFIEGRAVLTNKKTDPTVYIRKGQVISLYPLTEYMKEYLALKKKNKEGKRIAAISSLANAYKYDYEVITETGDFVFVNLKPGTYYIIADVHYASGVGSVEVSDIVEIKNDGDIISLQLKKTNKGWGYGGIEGRTRDGIPR
jgi:hypothetical protein